MEFAQAFEEIDRDYSGQITRKELERYMNEKNFEPRFVDKWMALFDQDGSGTITMEEFCDTLGLKPRQDYMDRVYARRQMTTTTVKTTHTDGSLKILQEDSGMNKSMRDYIIRLAVDGQSHHQKEKDIAQYIKTSMDKWDGRVWHVVVGRFHYGSFISHEAGHFIHFYVGRYSFLVWRTPE